jgi:hypothetical protein
MTRISAGDIVNDPSPSSSESSSEDVSGTRSGGFRYETVVSERVFDGRDDCPRRAATVMTDEGSIMYIHLNRCQDKYSRRKNVNKDDHRCMC